MARAKKAAKKKAAKKKTTKRKPTKRKAAKKAAKRKTTKRKGAGKKTAKKKNGRAKIKKQYAAVVAAMEKMGRPKTKRAQDLYDRFTRKTVRKEALACAAVKECRAYTRELIDALDVVFADWLVMQEDAQRYAAEVSDLLGALDSSQAEIRTLKSQLAAAKRRKDVSAADARTITSMLETQAKALKTLNTEVRKVARREGVQLPMTPARRQRRARPPARAPRRGRLAKTTAASGAGCSLAAARYGLAGKQLCAPKGYGPAEAGRRLANLRHHGVAFNPSDYFEMGYEAAMADGKPKSAKKRPAAKRAKKKRTTTAKRTASKPSARRNPAPKPATGEVYQQRTKKTLRKLFAGL